MTMLPSYMVEILRDLYEGRDWIDVYSFHLRYRLSPVQVSESLTFLRSEKIAEVDRAESGYRIKILPGGVQWIDSNISELFLTPRARTGWRRSPLRPSRDKGEMYLPKMSNLEVDFLATLGLESDSARAGLPSGVGTES